MTKSRDLKNQETFADPLPNVKLGAFLEAAPDAIVVVDHSGRIVMINQLTERLFGYQREEMIGQTVELLIPERARTVHIGHRTNYFHDPRNRPMGGGQELLGRKKDGTEFSVEISLSPLKSGQEPYVISIIRDVTPRKRLEAKFRGLLESAPDGIVVVDSLGKIAIVNSQTERMFGYSREELQGIPVEILIPDRFKSSHRPYREGYAHNPKTRPMGAGHALSGRKKDGTEFPVEISLSPLETEHGTLITSIIRDITERRNAEERMQTTIREKTALLKEKEALLKEIHHRVKNNLQVTSSLIRLQSDYIQDAKVREMFSESQNRIRSMALVHEKLYGSSDLSKIDLSDYSKGLAKLLFRSYGADPNQITLEIVGSPVFLSIEKAVPCGLILNELLSNCLKHAFPERAPGKIKLGIAMLGHDQVELSVSDDGIGLSKDFDFAGSETLGLQLVRTLVKQIEGTIELVNQRGTRFRISFSRERGN